MCRAKEESSLRVCGKEGRISFKNACERKDILSPLAPKIDFFSLVILYDLKKKKTTTTTLLCVQNVFGVVVAWSLSTVLDLCVTVLKERAIFSCCGCVCCDAK